MLFILFYQIPDNSSNYFFQFKILLSQIKKDWQQITNQEELRILKRISEESRLISFIYMGIIKN